MHLHDNNTFCSRFRSQLFVAYVRAFLHAIQSNANKRARVFLFDCPYLEHHIIQTYAPPVPVNSEFIIINNVLINPMFV